MKGPVFSTELSGDARAGRCDTLLANSPGLIQDGGFLALKWVPLAELLLQDVPMPNRMF